MLTRTRNLIGAESLLALGDLRPSDLKARLATLLTSERPPRLGKRPTRCCTAEARAARAPKPKNPQKGQVRELTRGPSGGNDPAHAALFVVTEQQASSGHTWFDSSSRAVNASKRLVSQARA